MGVERTKMKVLLPILHTGPKKLELAVSIIISKKSSNKH